MVMVKLCTLIECIKGVKVAKRLTKGKRAYLLRGVNTMNDWHSPFVIRADGWNSKEAAHLIAAQRAAGRLRRDRAYMAQYC